MPQCIVLLFVVQFEFESLCSNLNLNVFVFLLEKKMESFSLSLSWFPAHPAQPLLFPFFSPGPTAPLAAQSSRPSCLSRPAPPFPLSSHADRAAPPVGVLFLLTRAPHRCLWPRSSPAAAGGPLRPSKPSRRGPPTTAAPRPRRIRLRPCTRVWLELEPELDEGTPPRVSWTRTSRPITEPYK